MNLRSQQRASPPAPVSTSTSTSAAKTTTSGPRGRNINTAAPSPQPPAALPQPRPFNCVFARPNNTQTRWPPLMAREVRAPRQQNSRERQQTLSLSGPRPSGAAAPSLVRSPPQPERPSRHSYFIDSRACSSAPNYPLGQLRPAGLGPARPHRVLVLSFHAAHPQIAQSSPPAYTQLAGRPRRDAGEPGRP